MGVPGANALDTYAEDLIRQYATEYAGEDTDEHFKEAIQRVRDHLHSSQSSAAVCLICLEHMKNEDAVWHCSKGCCCVLHLLCIQAWARQQLAAASYKASQDTARGDMGKSIADHSWGCPKCRSLYLPSEVPTEYRCFCGKQRDPPVDPWLAPHTCGDMCGKQLPSGCGHSCVLLCHPGPCPPCPRQVEAVCHCGKVSKAARCSQADFSCGKLCGQKLACGHRCPHRCHPGPCPQCSLAAKMSCECGAETKTLPCSQRDFHCSKVCGKLLPCGRHTCQEVCHSGSCGGCPVEKGPRSCPCGKVQREGLACDEEAPPCGATCGKLLPCGRHHCTERCHMGPCTAMCRAMVDKPCVCGRTHKVLPCHDSFRCELRCSNTKSCGRHQCRRRCCEGDCPPCDLPCGRRLPCGNHKCPAPCHSGPCLPCPLSSTVACACGQTKYSLPCGTESKAAPPQCRHMCPVKPTCRHASLRQPHRCHWGGCPSCSHACGTPLPCGHACSSPKCHDKPAPHLPAFSQPLPPSSSAFTATKPVQAGAASSVAPAYQVASLVAETGSEAFLTDCPPCQTPVTTPCIGGHTTDALPCCSAEPFSCGAACQQPLACGNHTCSKPCHALLQPDAEPEPAGDASHIVAEACEVCERPCEKPRSCQHACPLPCHQGPCPACSESVELPCHCGRSLVAAACSETQQASRGSQAELLCCGKSCHKALPNCPHLCQHTCHEGPCPAAGAQGCQEEVTVRCPCRRHKAKMPCHQVQARLQDSAGSPFFTDATPLRLLPCDQDCQTAKSKKQADGTAAGSASEAQATAQREAPTPPDQTAAADASSSNVDASKAPRRRNKADRLAQQQQQQLLEEQAAKTAQKWARMWLCCQAAGGLVFAVIAFIVFHRMA